jgi:hypothetical protein
MNHFGKTLVLAWALFSYSSYSYSQTSANLIPYSSISLQGNLKFSPGDATIFGKGGGSLTYTGILTQKILQDTGVPLTITGVEYGWDYSLGCTGCKNYLTATTVLSDRIGTIYSKNYTLTGTGSVAERVTLGELRATTLDSFKLGFQGQQLWQEKQWQGPSVVNPYYRFTYMPNTTTPQPEIPQPKLPQIPQQLILQKPEQVLGTYVDPVKDALPKLVQDPIVNQVLEKPETTREYQAPTLNRGIPSTTTSQEKPKTTAATRISTQVTQQSNSKQTTNELVTIANMTSQAPSLDQYQRQVILDAAFYVTKDIYKTVQPVDNQRLLRGLTGSSNLNHGRMVDEQYRSK